MTNITLAQLFRGIKRSEWRARQYYAKAFFRKVAEFKVTRQDDPFATIKVTYWLKSGKAAKPHTLTRSMPTV